MKVAGRIKKSHIILAALLILVAFITWWIIGAGQWKVYFTESGVPMAGRKVRVDYDSRSLKIDKLDDKGCLNLGWRSSTRPEGILVWFEELDGSGRFRFIDGSYLDCARVDYSPTTTTITWKPRIGSTRWHECWTITKSGATTTITKTKRLLFFTSAESQIWTELGSAPSGTPVAMPNAPVAK